MIDFSLRNLVNRPDGWLGPPVTLVRVTVEGIPVRERLPALLAKALLLSDPDNGREYRTGHIEWDKVFDEW